MITEIILAQLRPDQMGIAKHPAKTKVLAMGRRWGKTVLGGTLAVLTANQGGSVAWVVPNFKNGHALWKWCERTLGDAARTGGVRFNKSERTIAFPRIGGSITIYSADNADAIRGEAFDLVIIDEAARIDESVWYEAIQPTLADREGNALLISTPNGLNWFWEEWEVGRERNDAEVASWQAPTAANPDSRIQRAAGKSRTRVPERAYRQEWLAEFIADEGAVFRNVRECATAELQPEAVPGHRYAFGVDWGKQNDFTVITVIDLTTKVVVWIERFNQIGYDVQVGRLRALYAKYRPEVIKPELNGIGQPLVDELRKLGMPLDPFHATNATKTVIIDGLVLALEQRELAIPDDPVLIKELLGFEFKRLPSGLTRYGARPGQHDDTVISLALAWSCQDNYVDWREAYGIVTCWRCGRDYSDYTKSEPCHYCWAPYRENAA